MGLCKRAKTICYSGRLAPSPDAGSLPLLLMIMKLVCVHKRIQLAVEDGRIKCFDLREGPADGDQDLKAWMLELEDVIREIMEDPVFKGNQNFSFELDLDAAGQRLFGGEANAGVAFQIGQLRYIQ